MYWDDPAHNVTNIHCDITMVCVLMDVSYMWSMRTIVWLLMAVLFCRLEFSKSSSTDAMARRDDLNVVHDCI